MMLDLGIELLTLPYNGVRRRRAACVMPRGPRWLCREHLAHHIASYLNASYLNGSLSKAMERYVHRIPLAGDTDNPR